MKSRFKPLPPKVSAAPKKPPTKAEIETWAQQGYAKGSGGTSLGWDQLGDATRSVWRERAVKALA